MTDSAPKRNDRTNDIALFLTNGDGTVDCAWCGKRFDADLALPDDNDDPICRLCAKAAGVITR